MFYMYKIRVPEVIPWSAPGVFVRLRAGRTATFLVALKAKAIANNLMNE